MARFEISGSLDSDDELNIEIDTCDGATESIYIKRSDFEIIAKAFGFVMALVPITHPVPQGDK